MSFTPTTMYHVGISLLSEDLAQAGLLLARFGYFAPEPLEEEMEHLPENPQQSYTSCFESARSHLQKILEFLEFAPDMGDSLPKQAPTLEQLQELEIWLAETWRQCSACAETAHQLEEKLNDIHNLKKLLHSYQHLDLDLGMLRRDYRFLNILTGTIPQENRTRLREAIAMIGYTLTPIARHEGQLHVVIAGLKENQESLDPVLKAADFHALQLPEAFSDHPSKVAHHLQQQEQKVLQEQRHLQLDIQERIEEIGGRLNQATQTLVAASGLHQFGLALRSRGGLAHIAGWVPAHKLDELETTLRSDLPGPVIMEHRQPTNKEQHKVPSCIQHSSWLQPFAALVRNYGVPRYREIDPTWFFAISFIIMFGMMFGDLGQGAIIFLTPWLFPKTLGGFRAILMGAGLSSMLFGLLYGSVFGYEHLLPALWISPLSNPVLMLKVAFVWGVGFILLASLLTIRNNLVEQHTAKALYDSQGVAGLLLYLSILLGGWQWLEQGKTSLLVQALFFLSLAVVLGYKWKEQEAPFGERLLVVIIEGFETFMNYISNTLSFLRVAAFGLNHVALAIAVFALADMLGATGHWITVVLGNLFILVLEGAIVVIQVLRLEYYEGFSRFFRGDGHEFRPMRLSGSDLLNVKP
ncbi:V-type ATP synthase subunit I [Thiolapillus sp.]